MIANICSCAQKGDVLLERLEELRVETVLCSFADFRANNLPFCSFCHQNIITHRAKV